MTELIFGNRINPLKHSSQEMMEKLTDLKVAVFMSAKDEKKLIRPNLVAIEVGLRIGLYSEFVLVLDGCLDSTAQITADVFQLPELCNTFNTCSKEFSSGSRATIIQHEFTEGKGASFRDAVFKLSEIGFFADGTPVVVNIDADCIKMRASNPFRLACDLVLKDKPMIASESTELMSVPDDISLESLKRGQVKSHLATPQVAGFRAIKGSALKPMLDGDPKWKDLFPSGICMEAALNLLIYPPDNFNDTDGSFCYSSGISELFAPAGRNVSCYEQDLLLEEIRNKYRRNYFSGRYGLHPIQEEKYELALK